MEKSERICERIWTDTQIRIAWGCYAMVQSVGQEVSPHPFTALTGFVRCINAIAEEASIHGSARVFQEALCEKMGYDYYQIMAGADEPECRLPGVKA